MIVMRKWLFQSLTVSEGEKGTAVCIGMPSYDWYYEKEDSIGKSLLFEYREDYAECFRLSHKINNKIQGGIHRLQKTMYPFEQTRNERFSNLKQNYEKIYLCFVYVHHS